MIEVIPYLPHHPKLMRPQVAQLTEVHAQPLTERVHGQAWTAVAGGLPICCAGLVEIWEGRAYAWALLDCDAGAHMLALTRGIRAQLSVARFRRIEMAVDAEFAEGARWARLLGFRLEVLAPRYMPTGRDALIFVRV